MSFWSENFWTANFWSENFWSDGVAVTPVEGSGLLLPGEFLVGRELHRIVSGTVPNQRLSADASDFIGFAQTFTSKTSPSRIVGVAWNVLKIGAPLGNLTSKIYATTSDHPDGAALSTSVTLNDVSLISDVEPGQWIGFFHDWLPPAGDTVYAVSLEPGDDWDAPDQSNAIAVALTLSDIGDGRACKIQEGDGAWSDFSSQDFDWILFEEVTSDILVGQSELTDHLTMV